MTASKSTRPVSFRVVTGGKPAAPSAAGAKIRFAEPRRPAMDADLLACEMARIFALTLVRDIPFAELSDPQRGVWTDAATRFTLHSLQSELRRIPWSSGHPVLPSGDMSLSDLLSLNVPGVSDRCASSSVAHNGQPSFSQDDCPDPEQILSAFFNAAPPRAAGPSNGGLAVAGVANPDAAHPMSHWLRWIEAACGARLPFPGRTDRARQAIRTPRDLAVQMHLRHPCQAYFSAALHLLAQGARLDSGLPRVPGGCGWSGPRLLALMLQGAQRASVSRRTPARDQRAARPGVVAARWSLMQSGEDMRAGPDYLLEKAALDRLKTCAPQVLHWMVRLNRSGGVGGIGKPGSCVDGWTPVTLSRNLMLPPLDQRAGRLCPSLGIGRAVLAGVMVTLLKAVFDTAQGVGVQGSTDSLADEFDKLAANVTSARTIAGGFYDVENRYGLSLGQNIALTLLRETLERDGMPATLGLRGFDGRDIALCARRNGPGSVRVGLRVKGAPASWPDGDDHPVPHLTAVI